MHSTKPLLLWRVALVVPGSMHFDAEHQSLGMLLRLAAALAASIVSTAKPSAVWKGDILSQNRSQAMISIFEGLVLAKANCT